MVPRAFYFIAWKTDEHREKLKKVATRLFVVSIFSITVNIIYAEALHFITALPVALLFIVLGLWLNLHWFVGENHGEVGDFDDFWEQQSQVVSSILSIVLYF